VIRYGYPLVNALVNEWLTSTHFRRSLCPRRNTRDPLPGAGAIAANAAGKDGSSYDQGALVRPNRSTQCQSVFSLSQE
jgi:hypothetical protein